MLHNNAQHEGQGDSTPVDPRGQAMRDAMWKGHGGFELALVPVFGGLIGWVADDFIGTKPILTIVCAVIGLGGAVANQYYRYAASMEVATAERLAIRQATSPSDVQPSGPAQSFGPVEEVQVDMTIDFSDSELAS